MTVPAAGVSWRALALSGLAGAALGIAVNGLIFGLGYGDGGATGGPEGPVNALIGTLVPFVWIGLFAGLGAAIRRLWGPRARPAAPAAMTLALLINCAVYPVYTLGFRSADLGLAGNYATGLLAVAAASAAWPRSRGASAVMALVVAWVTLASVGLYATQTGRMF